MLVKHLQLLEVQVSPFEFKAFLGIELHKPFLLSFHLELGLLQLIGLLQFLHHQQILLLYLLLDFA